MSAVQILPSPELRGCTAPGCDTQDTEWLSPFDGRRCTAHAPRFDAATAVAVALTDPDAAIAYTRAQWPEDGAA